MVYNDFTILQNVAASCSCCSCFAVVLTVVFFKTLRAKQYIRWVFYIAVNYMLAMLALAVGRTSNAIACWFQGILTNYSSLASICWITFISYKVYRIVLRNQKQLDLGEDKHVAQIEIYDNSTAAVLDNNHVVHFICWGLPLIATLLPLAASYRYENASDDDWTSYGNWCVLVSDNANDPDYELLLLKIASFYVWVWFAIMINIFYVYQTKKLFKEAFTKISSQELIDMMKDTIHKLEYYPYILIFCWLPSTIIEICSLDDNVVGYGIATFLTLLQGLLSSIVFFAVNPDVRQKWFSLVCCKPKEGGSDDGDEDGLIRDLIRKNSADEYNSMSGSFSEWTNSVDKYTNDFSHGLNSGGGSLNNSYSVGANNSFNVGTTGVYGMRNNNHYIYSALTSAPPPVAPISRPAEPSRQSSLFADHFTEDDESVDDGAR